MGFAIAAKLNGSRDNQRSSTRPKLLFLCQTLPFPPDGGVNIRTYNVLRMLSRQYDVTALCFYRATDRRGPEAIESSLNGLRRIVRAEAFPIPQEHHRIRLLWDHARSVLTRRAYVRYVYESAAFRVRVMELLRSEAFQLVHVDSLDLCAYLPAAARLPVVCVHHNVESQLLHRRAATESSWWRRQYVAHQARLFEAEERRWCPRVDLNVVVSAEDGRTLARIAPSARFSVVPNGVDVDYFMPGAGSSEDVVFVGGSNWFPNRDAREYFATEILPALRANGGTAPIRWVGHASEDDRIEYGARYGMDLTGYVDDVRPYLRNAACVVVPLRVGGGTRLKILDAWAMGRAVVSTSQGCEGLEAHDGHNILIRNTPETFAEAVRAVCTDLDLRRRLETNARTTAERTYAWDRVGERMLEDYATLFTPHVGHEQQNA